MQTIAPTDRNGVLTICCEVNGSKVTAHIAPWSIYAVAAVDDLLIIRIPGCEPVQFPCQSESEAEEHAGRIAGYMESARTGGS